MKFPRVDLPPSDLTASLESNVQLAFVDGAKPHMHVLQPLAQGNP